MNMLMTWLVVVYFQIRISSGLVATNNSVKFYYQQTYDLIENIIEWHDANANFRFVVVPDGTALPDHECTFLSDSVPKIMSNQHAVNFPDARNFAAIFFADASLLNMSLKLPPDVIKIYLDHQNGCQLNETNLAEIMNTLWRSSEIGFIYYISFCSSSTTANYDAIDNARPPHKDNCNINLFYHQPFERDKSGRWGVLEKVNLINDGGHAGRQWINMSQRVFQTFPFRRKHNLKLNRLNMTVILFPSTGAYHKSDLGILRNQLSQELLDNPFHSIDAYFGEDVEVLRTLMERMNFTLTLSPTSDRQLYGFRVSFNLQNFMSWLLGLSRAMRRRKEVPNSYFMLFSWTTLKVERLMV